MTQIANRLKVLIAEKGFRENRKLTYATISQETGIAPSTLTDWATGRAQRFDGETIIKFCEYFNCDVGDLLVLQTN